MRSGTAARRRGARLAATQLGLLYPPRLEAHAVRGTFGLQCRGELRHGNGDLFHVVRGEGDSKKKAVADAHVRLLAVQYRLMGVNLDSGPRGDGEPPRDVVEAIVEERTQCVLRAAALPNVEARWQVLRDGVGLS